MSARLFPRSYRPMLAGALFLLPHLPAIGQADPMPAVTTPAPAVISPAPPTGTQAPAAVVPDLGQAPVPTDVPASPPVTPPAPVDGPPAPPPTIQTPAAPVAAPTPISPTTPAVTHPVLSSGGSARALLTRFAPSPMGTNNGVRLWVHGDASGADMRVRVLVADPDADLGSTDLRTPIWISKVVPISFAGWREIVLPKSDFTLRSDPAADQLDMELPADAQGGEVTTPKAHWDDINAIGVELRAPKKTEVILDDVSWVTLDDDSKVASTTPVTDFELGDVAAWQQGGTRTQQQSVSYGLATAPGQVHGGRVAFKIDAVSPAYVRQSLMTQYLRRSLAASGKPYVTYVPASRFETILPSSVPQPGTTSSSLSIQACPDQIEAATFCLYTQSALRNVTVTLPQDLQAIGHTLGRANVDVKVVKVWTQLGEGPLRDPDTAGLTPELLVKDDRVPLAGPSPAIRLTGAPATDIPADSTKQFWITVSVPRDTPPGHYTGSLMVSAKGMPALAPMHLDVSVLPLRLMSSAKQYGIDLRSRLDPAPAELPSADGRQLVTDFVSKPILDAQLADISAHGFHISTLYDSPDTVWDAMNEYRANGISDPFIYKGDADPMTVEAGRKQHNAPPLLYYTDPDPIALSQSRMAAITKGGLLGTTYIARQADYDALQAELEVPVYNRDSPYAQQLLRTRGQRMNSKRDWWFWNATNADTEANRLNCGYLLWRSDLYGAFVPAYQTSFGTDPYDETSAGAVASEAAFRPEMLTYPAQGGVIDTLQWEACREGVTDTRYLTTMYAALRECKDAHIQKPLTDQAQAYIKAFLDKPLATLPDSELDKARAQITTYALQMRTAVDTYNKTHRVTP